VPAATNLYRRLLDPDVWTNSNGETTPIDDLTLDHRLNIIRYVTEDHRVPRIVCAAREAEDPYPGDSDYARDWVLSLPAPARITHLNNLELDDEYAAQHRAYADTDCTEHRWFTDNTRALRICLSCNTREDLPQQHEHTWIPISNSSVFYPDVPATVWARINAYSQPYAEQPVFAFHCPECDALTTRSLGQAYPIGTEAPIP